MIRREVHFGRVVPTFRDRPVHVDAMFRARVAAAPDAIAAIAGGRRTTYAALDFAVDRLAAGLLARGMGKGERIATLIGTRIEVIELSLAGARLGAIHVPLDIRQRRRVVVGGASAGAEAYEALVRQAAPPPRPAPVHGIRRRLLALQRYRGHRRRRLPESVRPQEGHDQPGRLQGLLRRGGRRDREPPGGFRRRRSSAIPILSSASGWPPS